MIYRATDELLTTGFGARVKANGAFISLADCAEFRRGEIAYIRKLNSRNELDELICDLRFVKQSDQFGNVAMLEYDDGKLIILKRWSDV